MIEDSTLPPGESIQLDYALATDLEISEWVSSGSLN